MSMWTVHRVEKLGPCACYEDREERTRNYHDEIKLAYQRHVVEEKMSNSSEGRPRITRGECKGTGEYVILFFKV